jgi:hypothetical protein
MITLEKFTEIDKEIKDAIRLTLNRLKTNSAGDYVLLLANGEFHDNGGYRAEVGPYFIDDQIDKYKDSTRRMFLGNLLTTRYSFPPDQVVVDDEETAIYVELMVYCHTWESKPYLRKLYRLAHLASGEAYPWHVDVPDTGKYDFVRNIRLTLEKAGSNLAQVIKKGFHSTLRNAFAHSEFSIDMNRKKIRLYNYKGKTWDIPNVTFDEWSERFVYSALLTHHLARALRHARINLINDFQTDHFKIKIPSIVHGQSWEETLVLKLKSDNDLDVDEDEGTFYAEKNLR